MMAPGRQMAICMDKNHAARLQKRLAEIETLFRRVYENSAFGNLPEKRFAALAEQYEKEQGKIESQIPELETAVSR